MFKIRRTPAVLCAMVMLAAACGNSPSGDGAAPAPDTAPTTTAPATAAAPDAAEPDTTDARHHAPRLPRRPTAAEPDRRRARRRRAGHLRRGSRARA